MGKTVVQKLMIARSDLQLSGNPLNISCLVIPVYKREPSL